MKQSAYIGIRLYPILPLHIRLAYATLKVLIYLFYIDRLCLADSCK